MLQIRRGDRFAHGIIRARLQRFGRAATALLYPLKCQACGTTFSSFPDARQAPHASGMSPAETEAFSPFWCPACMSGFRPIGSPLCTRCGTEFTGREGPDHLCGECVTTPKRFARARAVGTYDGLLITLVHALKYKGNTMLARPLSSVLFSAFERFWTAEEIDCVLPVPLYKRRMRARGFNQAWLLIRDWPGRLETAYGKNNGIEVRPDWLFRHRQTPPQTGLDKKLRQGNLKKAFSVGKSARIDGKNVLVVDDVLTTGATADECAGCLLAAGARRVDVLTLVRTM